MTFSFSVLSISIGAGFCTAAFSCPEATSHSSSLYIQRSHGAQAWWKRRESLAISDKSLKILNRSCVDLVYMCRHSKLCLKSKNIESETRYDLIGKYL